MVLASAYPESAISVLAMMAIAFVMAACLALWIGMVFIADRSPRKSKAHQKLLHGYTTVVAAPGKTAEDGHSEADHRHGAAA
jgi:hypothetical protein